jgi:hypothetical protein
MAATGHFEIVTHDTYFIVHIHWPIVALLAFVVATCVALAVLFSRRRKD